MFYSWVLDGVIIILILLFGSIDRSVGYMIRAHEILIKVSCALNCYCVLFITVLFPVCLRPLLGVLVIRLLLLRLLRRGGFFCIFYL